VTNGKKGCLFRVDEIILKYLLYLLVGLQRERMVVRLLGVFISLVRVLEDTWSGEMLFCAIL
jgi:hypothetical protein